MRAARVTGSQGVKIMKIFISYRRDDSAGYAGRLFDYLTEHCGSRQVFMDIDTIEPGDDFRKAVQNGIGTCDVVVVMIGRQWLTIADAQGHRRLDDPQDWVRAEVAIALANPKVRVISVLVHDASMPKASDLPDDLKELSYRNALELSDSRFQHDAGRLAEAIEQAARVPAGAAAGRGGNRYWGLAVGAVVLGGLALAFLSKGSWMPLFLPAPTPTATHTVTATAPRPVDTDTPVPSSPTATAAPESVAPVILDVAQSTTGTAPRQDITAVIHFRDPQGDASSITSELVGKTVSSNLTNPEAPILPSADLQKAGMTIPIHWKCAGSGKGYTVTFNFFVVDQAGNKSEPYPVTFHCTK
jgi:hypothetical protein